MLDLLKEVLTKRRTTAIVAAVSLVALHEFAKIPVPKIVENKFTFRLGYVIRGLVRQMAIIGSKLNYGSEPAIIRSIQSYLKYFNKKKSAVVSSKVNIIESQAEDVPLRIYFPKTNKDVILPVMIYYHGGSFVFNSASDYDDFLVWIVENIPIIIVSIDYHLAPEYEYPIPLEECYIGTRYFIENLSQYDFNIDRNRIILCGHSAGANIATVIAGKIRECDPTTVKLQVLLNPPTQYFNFSLPSQLAYSYLDYPLSRAKLALWHMGLDTVSESQERVLIRNQHMQLLDPGTRARYQSYLDTEFVGDQYKQGRYYYSLSAAITAPPTVGAIEKSSASTQQSREDVREVAVAENETGVIEIDKNFQSLLYNLFNTNVSPGLADDQQLKMQPKTYMIVSEYDARKDEALIYAERMSRQGVWVDVSFYERGFHCSILEQDGDETGCLMREDLINYLKMNI